MNVNFQKFSTMRNFGIELEIGNEVSLPTIATVINNFSPYPLRSNLYKHSVNNKFWDLKLDGSCGKITDCYGINEGGYEIASFKASGAKQLRHISKTAKCIKKTGAKTNENCGLHIHVDVQDFNEHDMGKLIACWLCVEKAVLLATPRRRRTNKYCLPLGTDNGGLAIPSEKEIDFIEVWNRFKPTNTSCHNNVYRRRTLNVLNWYRSTKVKNFKRSTVEFRFPEGTLVEANIKNWTILLVNFVHRIKTEMKRFAWAKKPELEDILFILGLGHNQNSFNILSDSLRETKIWFLRRLIRYCYDQPLEFDCIASDYGEQACNVLKKMGESCNVQRK